MRGRQNHVKSCKKKCGIIEQLRKASSGKKRVHPRGELLPREENLIRRGKTVAWGGNTIEIYDGGGATKDPGNVWQKKTRKKL